MARKELASILSGIPAATVEGQQRAVLEDQKIANELHKVSASDHYLSSKSLTLSEESERINVRVPKQLKEELKLYVKNHKGQTETSVILKALKSLGFKVQSEWLVDKRTIR